MKAVEFRGWLARRGFSRAKINRALSVLRGVGGCIVANCRNARLDACHSSARQRFLSIGTRDEEHSRTRARDRAVLALIDAGLSRAEIARLRLADFDAQLGGILRAGKWTKLQAEAVALLCEWVAVRGSSAPEAALFSSSNRPECGLTRSGVGQRVRTIADAATSENDSHAQDSSFVEVASQVLVTHPLSTGTAEKIA
ncbi:MAG TPA: hypothetical protein VGP72_00440 [Planctomycetota bacterium]